MRRFLSVALLLSILAAVLTASAQDQAPLVFWAQGDLWTWSEADPALQPLTADGTVSSAALSPDGTRIAYRVLSPVSRASLDQVESTGFIAEYELPTDLWWIDLTTRAALPLAVQAPDAALFTPGAPAPVVRSAPAWSAASDAAAWVEVGFGEGASGVIRVQNLVTAELATPVTAVPLTEQYVPEIRWGQSGFAVRTTLAADGPQTFLFYAVDGAPLGTANPMPDEGEVVQDFAWVWVIDQERDVLGVLFSSGRWALIDPATGGSLTPSDTPALFTPGVANAPVIHFGAMPDIGFFWEAAFPQSIEASVAYAGAPGRVAVSPDGQAIAFTGFPEFGGLALWRSGVMTPVAGTGSADPAALAATSVYWQPAVWRIESIN